MKGRQRIPFIIMIVGIMLLAAFFIVRSENNSMENTGLYLFFGSLVPYVAMMVFDLVIILRSNI